MKRAAISFTSMLMAVYNETLDLNAVDEFYVGCSRLHLPHPDSELLPFELGWCREIGTELMDMDYNAHLQHRDKFSPKQIAAYTRLWHAMASKPVYRYNTNIWDVCHYLLDTGCDEVWIQYKWETLVSQLEERCSGSGTPELTFIKIGGDHG